MLIALRSRGEHQRSKTTMRLYDMALSKAAHTVENICRSICSLDVVTELYRINSISAPTSVGKLLSMIRTERTEDPSPREDDEQNTNRGQTKRP